MARKKRAPAEIPDGVKAQDIERSKGSVTVDTGSGSMSFNRFEMQISQTLHMAIELYDSLDYLLILDYYDDITLFDDEKNPEIVSYYQMKTSEDSISLNTAISEDWLTKLYAQLERPDWLVKELGLITNCPLKVITDVKDHDGKDKKETVKYSSEKTPFTRFNPITINKVKQDIAKKQGINVEDVDLSKFVHIRTTLSIPKHREIVEQEMGDFLNKKYPRITIDSVKTIFSAMLEVLTKRQQYELLAKDTPHNEVRVKKGIAKSDFIRIIDEAMIISIPTFEDIYRVASFKEDEKYKASYEYTNILSDSQTKPDAFSSIFVQVRKLCADEKKNTEESIWEYANRLCDILYKGNFILEALYNRMYICVLIVCILINEGRRAV